VREPSTTVATDPQSGRSRGSDHSGPATSTASAPEAVSSQGLLRSGSWPAAKNAPVGGKRPVVR